VKTPRQYYRSDLKKLINFIVPTGSKKVVLENVNKLPDKSKLKKADYVILKNLIGNLDDIQEYLEKLRKNIEPESRVVIIYFNHLWEPIIKLATSLGLRTRAGEQNWLNQNDISNILKLSDYEVITSQKRLLFPAYIPIVSDILNKWVANLPIFNKLCLTTFAMARPKHPKTKELSVSIIVPARNEAGNIAEIIPSLPKFGKYQEIVFVEGGSEDNTWETILQEKNKKQKKHIIVKTFKQRGTGKADAVRLGASKASGDIIIIYDADRTVNAKDLGKFYSVLKTNQGEFANGSRLVYPMDKDAMRTLNKFGNHLFSSLFTWILGQNFKDTLCGTKAFSMENYKKIVKAKKVFGDIDPFGDFELIFGAIKNDLKVVEIPIRYKERVYGTTNISRFRHGALLFKMTWKAFEIFRAW